MKGKLVLSTGDIWEGELFIDGGVKTGRMVFDTRVVGYEKVLTSPEYCGKIVCFTYPLIGNYGINLEDIETDRIFPAGVIISKHSEIYSNCKAKCSLKEFLQDTGITVIEGIDTQHITTIVRENKGIKGVLAPAATDETEIENKIKENIEISLPVEKDIFVEDNDYIVVVNKIKRSELLLLKSFGIQLAFINSFSNALKETISKARGVYLASSFEDISFINRTAEIIREFVGDIPIFGAGAGHLAVAVALGGSISENIVNHYGINHPVRDVEKGKRYITAQSHSLVVDEKDIQDKLRFINITDGSVEGITDRKNKVFSVAFQPCKEMMEEFFSFL